MHWLGQVVSQYRTPGCSGRRRQRRANADPSCRKALDTIKPADIKLVQSFKNPPGAIKLVMEAVCVLLDLKPAKVPDPSGSGKKIDDYWEPSKKALSDPNFVNNLKTYDKDNISPKTIETIRRVYTSNPDFTPAVAAKASSAAEGLCKWVCAMERYEEVAKVVAPKQAALKEAQGAYDTVMAALTIKQVRHLLCASCLAAMGENWGHRGGEKVDKLLPRGSQCLCPAVVSLCSGVVVWYGGLRCRCLG